MSTLQAELREESLAIREAHNLAVFKLELLVDMWAMRELDAQAGVL